LCFETKSIFADGNAFLEEMTKSKQQNKLLPSANSVSHAGAIQVAAGIVNPALSSLTPDRGLHS